MSISLVYITTDSADQARRIGRALVEERIAACVNILGDMTSMYWWNGEIVEGQETVLIVKTRSALVDSVVDRVTELHEAETPCVLRLEVDGGNKAFIDWIENETV